MTISLPTARAHTPSDSFAATADSTASHASDRLLTLATLSGSLTDALDPNVAVRVVQMEALTVLGAAGAVVITLGAFPYIPTGESAGDGRLHVVEAIGNRAGLAALQDVQLDSRMPFAEVARSGEPLFLESAYAFSEHGEWGVAMLDAGIMACAIVPVWANGELRGVLGMSWQEPRAFDTDERAFVLTLGVMCAQAILRAHLRAAETKAREEAERANESKMTFLTMISHELRTPLNAVLGYTELISRGLDGPTSEKQCEHLARIQSASAHLLGLIEDLLGFARLEAGEVAVFAEEIDLIDTIEQSLDMIRPLAEEKGLRVRVETPDRPVMLFTDGGKLRQVLVNLLANAAKFTDEGEVCLHVHVEGVEVAARILFEVTDDGPGIAQDAQAHVFDAFWQVDPGSAISRSGSGLGLPIARQMARLLGGDIELVPCAHARGSTFMVTLPLRYRGAETS